MTKNINYVSHKKSKVKNNGKPQLPSANSLVEGEIAINYAKDVETLSIKNESGTVVTFSSDNYYTEKKLGSGFTESNSAVTVTSAMFEIEKAISDEASRATAAESALSSGKADKATTLAGYGITDAYTKSQTYTKTEVNGLVSTPPQNYVTVATYTDLPATGSANTIYRVSNWDGSANSGAGAVDVTVYSEYAWDDVSNPNKYVFLCVKSQIGEVFDISAYNNNAKYDTLADALGTNGEHVPQSIRRGGMSVKYVQNSDNKYVQARCMAQSFTTDVTQWQGVDEEPTAGSKNLVESAGVYDKVSYVSGNIAPYINFLYIENKESAIDDGLYFKYLQYRWSAVYFDTANNQQFLVSTLSLSFDSKFKYFFTNHERYGLIYGEVVLNGPDQILGNANNICSLAYRPALYEVIHRFSQYLPAADYDSNRSYKYLTDETLNNFIFAFYIQNEAVAKSDELVVTIIDFLYPNVWLRKGADSGNGTNHRLGLMDNGHYFAMWDDERYGLCYIELYSGNGQQNYASDISAGIKSNICDRAYINNNYVMSMLNFYPTDTAIYGSKTSNQYLTDNNLKEYIDYLSIENRNAAIEDSLFISTVQYTYNAIYFGYKENRDLIVLTVDATTKYGELTHERYGKICVRLKTGYTGNFLSKLLGFNFTELCFNPFYKDGLIKEIKNIKQQIAEIEKPLYGKKILAIGDSVTAGHQWGNKVAEVTGAEVSFHAKGGTHIINMVDGDNAGFPALSNADVEDKDYIIALGFYNDRFDGSGGTETDMYPSQNTFTGKLNYLVAKVYEKLIATNNRKCKIIIVSAHRYGKYAYIDKTAYQDGEELFNATKLVADYNSVDFIDLMHRANINKYNWDWMQSSNTNYNQNYIPADGINDATNKPFTSLSNAPVASDNNGKYITISGETGCYLSENEEWVHKTIPYIWNGDQLHPNNDGYSRIGEYIAGHLLTLK